MNAYASPENGADHFGRRMEEFFSNIEVEVRHAVAYVDRVIVPEARREAGTAARVLASHLERLADKLHPNPPAQSDPAGNRDL